MIGAHYQIQAPGGADTHIQGLEQAFGSLSNKEDLTLYCQNKTTLKTNKMPLLFTSKLVEKILSDTCHCTGQEFEIICPDFDPDSMARVLQLLNTGATNLESEKKSVYTGMLYIIECLQIDVKLEEIWFNGNTLKPKSRSTIADNDSTSFSVNNDSSSFFESNAGSKPVSYSCHKCSKTFKLLTGLQRHDKKHLNLVDSGLDNSQTNQDILTKDSSSEPNTFIDDLTMETLESMSRNLEALVEQPNVDDFSTLDELGPDESTLQEQIDIINKFSCCNKSFKNFDSYDQHVEDHFLGSPTKRKRPRKSNSHHLVLSNDRDAVTIQYLKSKPEDKTGQKQSLKMSGKKSGKKQNPDKKKCKVTQFPCPLCKKIASKYCHLLVHVMNKHYKKEFLQLIPKTGQNCHLCPNNFAARSHLKSHLLLKHKFLNQIVTKDMMEKLESTTTQRGRLKLKSSK